MVTSNLKPSSTDAPVNNGQLNTEPASQRFDPDKLLDTSVWPGSAVFYTARQLVGVAEFNASDLPDLQQDLAIHAWRQWPKYNPHRSSPRTFLDRILRRRQQAILRKRRSEQIRTVTVPLIEDLNQDARGRSCLDHVKAIDRRHDVTHVVAGLPAEERRLVRELVHYSVSLLARIRGCHRQRLHESIRRLRKRFEDDVLREYLT